MKKTLLFLFVLLSFNAIYSQLTVTVAVTDSFCTNPGFAVVNASGGVGPYQYSIGAGGPYQLSNTFTGLIPGTYTVWVVDANSSNTGSQSFTINPPLQPLVVTPTVISGIFCAGGNDASITTIASGGQPPYTYYWYNYSNLTTGGPFISNTFSGLFAGNYGIEVVDAVGCSMSDSLVINEPTPLNLTISTNPSQDEVTLHATGGTPPYVFSVAPFGTIVQAGNVFSGLPSGNYTFSVIDMNNCTTSNTVTLTGSGFSAFITASLDIPTSTLFANTIGGVGSFTYQWSLNGVTLPNADQETLSVLGQSGLFSVIITDANSSTAFAEFYVSEDAIIANDDAINIFPVSGNFAVSEESVLANDIHNEEPNFPTITVLTIPDGFVLNPDGTVAVLSGTPSGTYTITYQICSTVTPTECDNATAVINVINEGILLNAFIDSNGNGTQEVGEPNFTQGQFGFELNNDGTVNHAFSSNGEYLIGVPNPTDSYDLSYAVNPAYASNFTLTISSYNDVSVVTGSGVTTYNFPVTQVPFHDLQVYLSPNGASPRPGFVYVNHLTYRNNGNQTIASGTVTFNKSNVVTIVNVSVPGTINTPTGFTYDFTNLLPGEMRYLQVTMQVPTIPTVALGDMLTNTADITIPAGDGNVSDNSATLTQTIVGSYDPNDKSEVHGGKILHSIFTSNDYLTYTIQFENTGTANAENVSVEDYLHAKLDEDTIKMIDASHPYTLTRTGEHLVWSFIGIELPPSVADTPIGKGYITFQVKPESGYVVGDFIQNTASIFFDFNPAIVTNTTHTEFVTALSVSEFENAAFKAYPNPTNGFITISLKNNAEVIDAVTVNDVLGKTIQTQTFNTSNAVIDLSQVSKGIYFVKVSSAGQEKVLKVIRE